MDARDAVSSVSSGSDQVRISTVVEGRAVTASVKDEGIEVPAQDSDAVKIDVSTEELRTAEQQSEPTPRKAREDIEEQAAQLERTLNSKVVRFRVAVKEGEKAEMHFQVVDRETGKIVREFPPEKAHDFDDIAGMMLDKLA